MTSTDRTEATRHLRERACVTGFHHIALTTDDMRTTADFLVGVLGMTLVRAARLRPGMGTGPLNIGNPPFEQIRYYFFAFTEDLVVSVFEIPRDAMPKADRNAIGGMQEMTFSADREGFSALQERLTSRGISFVGPREILPGLFTIIFYDPNGIRMEALFDSAPDRAAVIDSLVLPVEDVRAEIATLGEDPAWMAAMLAYWDPGQPK